MAKIKVLDAHITVVKDDYISLTDIANSKDNELRTSDIIKNWIRNRSTLEFIDTWELLYNPDFKVVEFDHFKMSAGLPFQRVQKLNQIAISQMKILVEHRNFKKLDKK